MIDNCILLHDADDVLIARQDVAPGHMGRSNGVEVRAIDAIAAGHKLARRRVAAGSPVHRYGQYIGFALEDIEAGQHVHVHNLGLGSVQADATPGADARPLGPSTFREPPSFQGYLRSDGRVGTRNYLAVVSTVNCSATLARVVSERFRDVQRDFPHVDGVFAITHKSGCAQVPGSYDHVLLQRVLAGYANHPNVAGYVLVGLGCEVNQPESVAARHQLSLMGSGPPIVSIQRAGGLQRAIEATCSIIADMLPRANEARRTRQPLSKLVVATNCGGSDGSSGITANPALGLAVDEIVRHGGTGVLAETTEIYGAEHLLIRRAVSREVAAKLQLRIDWWKRHLALFGAEMSHNPAPGNRTGGITTVYEKSLGGIAKGGSSPLVDVLEYGEPIRSKGFVFMDTPGHDPVSVTGLVAGGANLVCFTTGRGSVFGCKPTPSLKLATNSALYQRMPDDMDIDCGVVLAGEPLEAVGRRVFDELLATASGKKTKSEAQGLGDEEFAPWAIGPVL